MSFAASRGTNSAAGSPAPGPAPSFSSVFDPDEVGSSGGGSGGDNETTWLQPFQRSWEWIDEDEATGQLKSTQLHHERQRKQRLTSSSSSSSSAVTIEKGVIRALYIIIDLSHSSTLTDLKPSRRLLTLTLLLDFIAEFFDQNPISQLGFILSYDKLAYKCTELSAHPNEQCARLRARIEQIILDEEHQGKQRQAAGGGGSTSGGGEFSLQNSLEMARSSLSHLPPYASKEVLVIMSSLSTVDASDIHSTVQSLAQSMISCSVLHLSAELYICAQLAAKTRGTHRVVLHRDHYAASLRAHLPPAPHTVQHARSLARKWIKMGFPTQSTSSVYPAYCACHRRLAYTSYVCPQCLSRYCELPTQCNVCELTLVSSPQLARTYHHLFPVPQFPLIDPNPVLSLAPSHSSSLVMSDQQQREQSSPMDISASDRSSSSSSGGDGSAGSEAEWVDVCFACTAVLTSSENVRVRCEQCRCVFCIDCDEFIHTRLHNCPGCWIHTEPSHKPSLPATTAAALTARNDVTIKQEPR